MTEKGGAGMTEKGGTGVTEWGCGYDGGGCGCVTEEGAGVTEEGAEMAGKWARDDGGGWGAAGRGVGVARV